MRWGILLVAIGIACYIVHAILLNYFLRKNAPEVLACNPGVPSRRPRQVYLVRGATPRWVTLLGLPALPLLLLGIVLIAITCLVTVLH
jgi:hypothetical protein